MGTFVLIQPTQTFYERINDDYYGGPPGVDTIIFNLGGLDDVLMYKRDEIDVARVTGQNLSRLIDPNDALNEELVVGPSAFRVRFIGFNTTMPPFDDARFRQALNHAVDKDVIAQEVLFGRVQPAFGILPPGFPGFNPSLEGLQFDPELARALLGESAYADPGTRPRMVVTVPDPGAETSVLALEVVLQMWRQILGVEVEIKHVEWATFLQGLQNKELQVFTLGWLADYPDQHALLDMLFHPESDFNYVAYASPSVREILNIARVEQDPNRRANLYRQAEQTIVNDAAWVPLWFSGNQHALVKPHVKGFRLTPMIVPGLRHVTIEGRPPAPEPTSQIAPLGAGATGHLLFAGTWAGQPPAQLGLDAAPGDGYPWPLLQVAGTQVVALSFVDEAKGWALQANGTVLTTDDGGKSWRVQATNVVSCCDGDIFFLEGGTGFAVGGSGTIARTDDGGASWTPLASGPLSDIRDVYFFNGNVGWIAADSLFATGDGGATWDNVVGRSAGLVDIFVSPSSPSYAWAGGNEGEIKFTQDGGRTWQLNGEEPGSVPPPVNIEGMFFVTPELGWAVGSAPPSDPRGPAIQRSNDGGATWQPVYQADLRSALRAITFTPFGIGWAVGEDGLVVRFDPTEDLRALLDPDGELGLDIFVMNADGSGRTNLTNSPGGDFVPAWSPDGGRVAFTSQRTGDTEIWVMGNDGTAQVNLTNHPGNDQHATWSPDGGRIAFGSDREGQFDVWVMNSDGSGVTNLSNNPTFDNYPDWSPDGALIAFHSDRTGQHDIWVMSADGSEQMDLTGDPGADSGPAWSPDGTRIAFVSDRDGNSEIFVMSADGTEQTQLTFTEPEVLSRWPAWSPDGGSVIFHSNSDGLGWNLWRMELATGALTNLTEPYTGRSLLADWARGPTPAGAVSGAQTFLEDFEGDFASRVSLPEGFEVSQDAEGNHALLATFVGHPAPAADVITVPYPGDEGYTFLLDINPLGQGNPGLALAGPDGHYKLEFDHTLNETHILACKVVGPSDQPEWCEEAVFRPIQGDAWHTMAIMVLRDNFAVWVDGARVLDRADSDPVLGEGATISPYVIGGKVLFDNIGLKGAAAGAVSGAQTFIEDFEGDFADRVPLREGFEIIQDSDGNHALMSAFVEHPAPALDVITIPFPGDEGYTFHIEVNPLDGGSPGLAIAGPDGSYKLEFFQDPDSTTIKVCKGRSSGGTEWCEEATLGPIRGDQWHSLALQVLANELKLFGPDGLILVRADSDPVLRESATISPFSTGEKVLFDNIGLKGAVVGAGARAEPAAAAAPVQPAAAAAPKRKQEPEPAPAPAPATDPETKRGFLVNTRPGEEAIPIEGLLDPVLLSIIGILATIFAALIQLVRGR